MILQDLIRNIVLYKGFIRPFIQTWKESLSLVPSRVSPSGASVNTKFAKNKVRQPQVLLSRARAARHGLSYRLRRETTGFNTITIYKTVYSEDFSLGSLSIISEIVALNSRSFTLLLEGNDISERAIMASKTTISTVELGMGFLAEKTTNVTCSTTGFENEKISSILFHETHERREYLGEFSLPHEEIQLMYRKEGGE